MSRFLDEAKTLLSIPTVSPEGTDALVHHLGRLMEASGLLVKTQTVRTSVEGVQQKQVNVLGVLGSPLVDRKIKKGLLLLAPLDTLSPGLPQDWNQTGGAIWDATVRDDKMYGSGACDGKLAFLCMLTSLRKFRERKTRHPVYLVGTCGEKLGALGSRYLLESWAVNPAAVVIAKPTGMRHGFASPGAATVQVHIRYQMVERGVKDFTRRIHLTARGLTAPASHADLGLNAIQELLRLTEDLMKPGMEVKWSHVGGGGILPQVPDQASLDFFVSSQIIDEYRHHLREVMARPENAERFSVELKGVGDTGMAFLPAQIMDAVRGAAARVQSLAETKSFRQCLCHVRQDSGRLTLTFALEAVTSDQDLGGILAEIEQDVVQWALQFPSFAIHFEKQFEWPAFRGSEAASAAGLDAAIAASLSAGGLKPGRTALPASTEAGFFAMRGYETAVVGPGDIEESGGRPNEHNSLDQLEGAIRFYEALIQRVCE